MVSNELKTPSVLHLTEKYGDKRVEDAMIFISRATDAMGLLVNIPPTPERVEAVLKAVYGEYE